MGGGERGSLPSKKNFPPNFCYLKNFPEGGTAAAGRQGLLEEVGRDGGVLRTQNLFSKNKFCLKIFPEGAFAAAGRQGVLEEGRREGVGIRPAQKNGPQILFSKKILRRDHSSRRPPGVTGECKAGRGRGSPPIKYFLPSKFFRMGHCGRRPPGEEGGGSHPQQIFPYNFFPKGPLAILAALVPFSLNVFSLKM